MILALDTATPRVSVALHDGAAGGEVLAERRSEQSMKHGELLAPLVAEVLEQAGVERDRITSVAVGAGPGPFTGLRVGLVTARTLGHVLGVPVRAVCTLDVLAVEAVDTGAVAGEFLVATDARRKEVYVARYTDGVRVEGPEVLKPAAAASDLPVVGEGARLYPDAFPHPVGPSLPSAGWLARVVADRRAELLPPEPLYLRRPDAATPGTPKPVS